jgi:hypothetical protein
LLKRRAGEAKIALVLENYPNLLLLSVLASPTQVRTSGSVTHAYICDLLMGFLFFSLKN